MQEEIISPKAIQSEEDLKNIPLSHHLFIESSAGTGKTFTLENLYARLIKERGLSLSEILVVTFTEAAGAELKERIQEKLKEDKSLISNFHESQIFTIHGFSQKILREYASFFGIPDNFSLITRNKDLDNLKNEAIHSFFRSYQKEIAQEEILLKGYEALLNRCSSKKNFNDLKGFLFNVFSLEKMESLKKFLREKEALSLRKFWDNKEDTNLFSLINKWREKLAPFLENEEVLDSFNRTTIKKVKGAFVLLNSCRTIEVIWEKLTELTIPDILEPKTKEDMTFHPLDKLMHFSLKVDYYESAKSLSKTLLNEKEELINIALRVKEILPSCLFDKPYQSKSKDKKQESLLTLFLAWNFTYIALIKSYEEIEKLKKLKSILTFDDLILKLFEGHKNLKESQKEELRNLYKAILIDEFQDTDNEQWHIFSQILLGEETSLTMIGDPKQAIYGFRGAGIGSFYQAKEKMLSHKKTNLYYLPVCHRSEESLIHSFNTIFEEVFKEELKTFKLDSFEKVLPKKTDDEDLLSFKPISLLVGEEKKDLCDTYEEFLYFLEEFIYEKKIAPKDCLILSRSNSELEELISISKKLKEKKSFSLSLIIQKDSLLTDRKEYKQTIDFLNFIENPNYYFSQIMISPFFDLNIKEVAWISQSEQEKFKQKITANLNEIYSNFYEVGNLWVLFDEIEKFSQEVRQEMKESLPFLSPLRKYQLEKLGWEERFIVKEEEEVLFYFRQTFSWLAKEVQGLKSINSFLKDINLGKRNIVTSQAFPNETKIPLMTMHQSKGLESPFVFILASKEFPNKKWATPCYSFYEEDCIKEDFFKLEKNKEKALLKLWQEEKNLLYVALTRAEKKVFLLWANKESSLMHKFISILSLKPKNKEELASLLLGKDNLSQEDLLGEEKIPLTLGVININGKKPTLKEKNLPNEIKENLSFQKLPLNLNEIFRKSPHTSSFSSLTSNQTSYQEPEITQSPIENISSLPKGASLGNWIHYLFEKLSFSIDGNINHQEEWKKTTLKGGEEKTIEDIFRESLKDHLPFVKDKEETLEQALTMVFNILTKNFIQRKFSLSQIDNKKIIKEREFNLKLNLNELKRNSLKKLGNWTIPLVHSLKSGFMTGIIDCLFEIEGKLYLLDWKTNFLGNEPSDYHSEKLKIAMQENNYDLQYHLYAVALKIWFEKYQPNISFKEIFGGVYYIFTRAFLKENLGENGIFFQEIPIETLNLLEEFIFKGENNPHEI